MTPPDASAIEKAYSTITQPAILTNFPLCISPEEHKAELTSMGEIVDYEKFYFVVNRCDKTIEHINGLNRWLGYKEDSFDLKKYFEIIHPVQLNFLIPLAEVAFKMAETLKFSLKFRQQQYIVDVVLQHANGHYVLCKRALTPWQWQMTENKQIITHYFLEFTVTNHYLETLNYDLSPRIYDRHHQVMTNLEALLRKTTSGMIENEAHMFTTQELRILRKIAYKPEITAEEIATAFKTKKSTIHTFNKKIKEKGRAYLQDDSITNARDLALRLKNSYWL